MNHSVPFLAQPQLPWARMKTLLSGETSFFFADINLDVFPTLYSYTFQNLYCLDFTFLFYSFHRVMSWSIDYDIPRGTVISFWFGWCL